jgi:outer membrane protein TolC
MAFKKKIMKAFFVSFMGVLGCLHQLNAQELTPEQAVEKAFKNHPDLQAAEKLKNIAALNNSLGRAGALPQVSFNSGWNTATQNANLTFNNGSEISRKGAGSSSLNGNLQVNQVLFDGMGVQARKKTLEWEEVAAGEVVSIRKKLLREQVLNAYYNWVNELQWLEQMKGMDFFFSVKTKQTELLFQNGKATEADVLQAKADEALQNAQTLNRKSTSMEALASLNLLMFAPADMQYRPSIKEISVDLPMPDTSETALLNSSSELRLRKAEWETMKQNQRLAKSEMLPTLSMQLNSSYLNSRSDVGILLRNQTTASNIGINLNYSIFNGGVIRKEIQIAEFRTAMAEIAYKKAEMELKNVIYILVKQWRNYQMQVELQKKASNQYKEVLQISKDAYLLGKYNRVELSQAQFQYESAYATLMSSQIKSLQYYHALQRILTAD